MLYTQPLGTLNEQKVLSESKGLFCLSEMSWERQWLVLFRKWVVNIERGFGSCEF